MEASLEYFKAMSRTQRELVIRSIEKMANMSQDERTAFFRNTERWNGMSEGERKKWADARDADAAAAARLRE